MQTVIYGQELAVAICADSDAGIARCREAIVAAGARPALTIGTEHAADMLDIVPAAYAVLVDIERDGGEALDRLLDRLNAAAQEGAYASIIVAPPSLIDVVAALAPHEGVIHLCEETPAERADAVARALGNRSEPILRDRDDSPVQLRQLTAEVQRIARALAEISGADEAADSGGAPPLSLPVGELPSLQSVRAAIRARRLREQYFAAELFADPAWDMLLDLLLARIERRAVAVSSLCIAAAVPPTTALRWIKRLTEEGVFVRKADPRDGRRVFIDLAPATIEAMSAYFRSLDQIK